MKLKNLLALMLALTFSVLPTYASMQWYNGSSVNLGNLTRAKCGNGLTCTVSNGQLAMSASALTDPITLTNGEILTNADTDDIVTLKSNDEHTTLQLLGFEAKNAILELAADQSDDSGDSFFIKADTSDELSILNEATVLTKWDVNGVQTLKDSETVTNASDVITFAFDDAAANIKVAGFEASKSSLTLQADESDDNGDDWQITSEVANTFTIANDTSGSFVAKMTISTTGDVTGPGTGALSGYLQKQVASTTTSITAAQCGSTFVSDSADVMALPEASTVLGCRLTFICGTADDFDVNPDNADIIGPMNVVGGGAASAITPSAGDAVRCTDIGSSFTIEAIAADRWAAVGPANGAVTDVN